jgi:hypothetical protein
MAQADSSAVEVIPAPPRKNWSRKEVAEWLVERLAEEVPTLVGIDHGFSFPLAYFEAHELAPDWPAFLDDFQRHWPTDEPDTWVRDVLNGSKGTASSRRGDKTWLRLTETKARSAKSVFNFDQKQGSVAFSTHAGIPWLRFIRQRLGDRVHFWPFDGWGIPGGRSAIVEVYPALWNSSIAREPGDRTNDQHDAFSVATWLSRADRGGSLAAFLHPELTAAETRTAKIEGWILGLGRAP